jgi:hypothetical protein
MVFVTFVIVPWGVRARDCRQKGGLVGLWPNFQYISGTPGESRHSGDGRDEGVMPGRRMSQIDSGLPLYLHTLSYRC